MGSMLMDASSPNPELTEERDSESALFQRRIEFHLERKPFSGFCADGGDGFKLITLNPNANTPKASTLFSKPEKLERLENGFDPDLSVEISFRRIGAGLRNLGNTCFLNSVLQCLTYTEPLAAYLQSGKHQNSCRKAGFCALCAIQKHVSRALQATGRILEPKDLVSNLRSISRNFRNARQEDAHEYMVNLLESMHKCCLPSGVPSESPSAYEKSLVHGIFGGHLRSQVKCLQCSFCSDKFDPFLDLSLEIVKADSLRKALTHFTSKELLDGGARQYQCQQCKQKVKALKQLTIHKAPHVLAIHLKRFSEHDPGQKINKDIAFEPTLDLKPFVTGPCDGDLSYTLYGVLVHAGWNTRSGHYYCFVRTSSGMWYSLDDNQVIQVNERKVLGQKAYILFYFRDRKTMYTKKSVEIIKKEKMVLNALGNAANQKINVDLKEKIQIGSVANKFGDVGPPSVAQEIAVFCSAPKKTSLEKECADKSRVFSANGSSGIHFENKSVAPQSTDLLNNHGCATITSVGPKEVPCSNSEGVVQKHGYVEENVVIKNAASQNGSAVIFSERENVPLTHVVVQNGNAVKPAHKEGQSDIHSVSTGQSHSDTAVISAEFPEKTLPEKEQNDAHSLQPKSEDAVQNGVLAHAIVQNGSSFISGECIVPEKAHCDVLNNVHSMQLTCVPCAVSQVSPHVPAEQIFDEVIGSTDLVHQGKKNKSRLTVKRTPLKNHVATTSFSSSIFLGLLISTWNKHHKRRKHHSSKTKDSLTKDMADESNSTLISAPSVKLQKEIDCDSAAVDQYLNSEGDKPGVCSESADPKSRVINSIDSSIYSTGKPPQPVSEYLRKTKKADVMKMLTQSINVARWEDDDVSPAEEMHAKPAKMGYVGGEWDEEYDRGKRKKIRSSRIMFGGSNLFQEIATRKLKRTKLQHTSSSDNRPFRIQ